MIHPFSMLMMTRLDDAPWIWGQGDADATSYGSGLWSKGMPDFFKEVQDAYPGSEVYANVFDTLDTTPVTWSYIHTGDPAMPDPTAYQTEWLGKVINIY